VKSNFAALSRWEVRCCIFLLPFVVRILLVAPTIFQFKEERATVKLRPYHAGEIWIRSFISAVRPTVHTNPSRKRIGLFRNCLQARGIWNRRLCVLVRAKSILETELFNDVTIIRWFRWPSFPQAQIQNDGWLLRFQICPAYCGRKTTDGFSGWKLPFQISPV